MEVLDLLACVHAGDLDEATGVVLAHCPDLAAGPRLVALAAAVVDHDDQAVSRALQRLAGAEVEVMATVTAVIALATATLCFVAMEAGCTARASRGWCDGSGRAAP